METLNAWRTFPIFISSTFKDMQAERDFLNTFIVPKLEKEFAPYRVGFKVIDLRWGVVTSNIPENEREAKVLKVCLDAVDNSRPFFVALLGGRYGWVPNNNHWLNIYKSLNKDERKLINNTAGKSVTELEILFGALGNPHEILSRSLFFLRSENSYDGMNDDQRSFYCDQKPEDIEKLIALKNNIREVCDNHKLNKAIHEYDLTWNGKQFDGLKEWGEIVFENLCREIKEEINITNENLPKNWYEEEDVIMSRFLDYHIQRFKGRERLLEESCNFLLNNDKAKILLAFSGAGKSAFMCKLYNELTHNEYSSRIVLFHSAGISQYAQQVERMLQSWNKILCTKLGFDYIEETENEEEQNQPLQERVKIQFIALTSLAKERGYKIILLVDALDRFSQDKMAKYMQWLPDDISFLCTSTPGEEKDVLKVHPHIALENMPLFSESEAKAMLAQICENNEKELYAEVVEVLLKKRNEDYFAHTSPLWISLVGNILFGLDADDFKEIQNKNIKGDEAKIISFLCDLAESFSSDSQELFLDLLQRASKNFGHELTFKSMKYIALSRNGLREKDLSVLLGSDWDELMFTSLCRWFRHLVIESADRLWTFAHIKLTSALVGYNENTDIADHRRIVDYLLSVPKDDPLRTREMFYHLIEGDYKEKIASSYVDFTDEARKNAEDILWAYYKNDSSILNYLADCTKYVADDNDSAVFYAGYLIVDFGPKISFGNPTGFVEMARRIFDYISYKDCCINLNLTRWLGIISSNVSIRCTHASDFEKLKFFSEMQVYCYEILVEEFKDAPNAEVFKNNLAMAFHKLGEYYSSQGEKDLANECFNKMVALEKANNDPLENKEPLIRNALSDLAKAQGAKENGDLDAAEGYMLSSYKRMEELYNLDSSDDRISKGLISAIGQLSLFYMQEDRLDDALPYLEKGEKLNDYLYKQSPTPELVMGNCLLCFQLIQIYLEIGNPAKARYYFKQMDEKVTFAQREYPDDEKIAMCVQRRDQVAYIIDEEEFEEDCEEDTEELPASSKSRFEQIAEYVFDNPDIIEKYEKWGANGECEIDQSRLVKDITNGIFDEEFDRSHSVDITDIKSAITSAKESENETKTSVAGRPTENERNNTNKKNFAEVILVLIIFAAIIFGGYLIYDYFFGNSTPKESVTIEYSDDEKTEDTDLNNIIRSENINPARDENEPDTKNFQSMEIVTINEPEEVIVSNKVPETSTTTDSENTVKEEAIPAQTGPRYSVINYPTGNSYAGYVNASGKREGKGIYIWTSGDKYDGDWINDEATGKGIYYHHEGWRYEGEFKNLKFHGKGIYYFADGKKRKGVWKDGKLQ